MVALTERFEMRLDEATIRRVDEWREERGGSSRAEAIRNLVQMGLEADSRDVVHFSDGEKVLLLMMQDLYKHLDLTEPEVDPRFVAEVIHGGHYWAPRWVWPGIFHGHSDRIENLNFVVDVLDMWNFIERGHEQLSEAGRKEVEADAEPFGKFVRFTGFDGNSEGELIGIARFLVEELGRFSRFKGRELNAHLPTIGANTRMLDVFEPLEPKLVGRELTANELVDILKAWKYPE